MLHRLVTVLDTQNLIQQVVNKHCSDYFYYHKTKSNVQADLRHYWPFAFPREVHLTMPHPAQDAHFASLLEEERFTATIRALQDVEMRVVGPYLDVTM
jgi:hypothetical protein